MRTPIDVTFYIGGIFMIHYRKILELRAEGISLRGIATSTNHSRQKVTEIIDLAEKNGYRLCVYHK